MKRVDVREDLSYEELLEIYAVLGVNITEPNLENSFSNRSRSDVLDKSKSSRTRERNLQEAWNKNRHRNVLEQACKAPAPEDNSETFAPKIVAQPLSSLSQSSARKLNKRETICATKIDFDSVHEELSEKYRLRESKRMEHESHEELRRQKASLESKKGRDKNMKRLKRLGLLEIDGVPSVPVRLYKNFMGELIYYLQPLFINGKLGSRYLIKKINYYNVY